MIVDEDERLRLRQRENNAQGSRMIAEAFASGTGSEHIVVRDASSTKRETWAKVELTSGQIVLWFPPIGPISARIPVPYGATPLQVADLVFDPLEHRRA